MLDRIVYPVLVSRSTTRRTLVSCTRIEGDKREIGDRHRKALRWWLTSQAWWAQRRCPSPFQPDRPARNGTLPHALENRLDAGFRLE